MALTKARLLKRDFPVHGLSLRTSKNILVPTSLCVQKQKQCWHAKVDHLLYGPGLWKQTVAHGRRLARPSISVSRRAPNVHQRMCTTGRPFSASRRAFWPITQTKTPVRDTPPYRAIPFRDSITEGGIAPMCLVFIGYRASIVRSGMATTKSISRRHPPHPIRLPDRAGLIWENPPSNRPEIHGLESSQQEILSPTVLVTTWLDTWKGLCSEPQAQQGHKKYGRKEPPFRKPILVRYLVFHADPPVLQDRKRHGWSGNAGLFLIPCQQWVMQWW